MTQLLIDHALASDPQASSTLTSSGDFVNDEIEGSGRYVYGNGDLYEGGFKAGKRHGYGMYHYKVCWLVLRGWLSEVP